jgi:hypothetical protein
MTVKEPSLSKPMLSVLRLLACEGPMTPRKLNDRLYQTSPQRLPQSRRVFAASMSRTIRRMERRQLVFSEGGTIAIAEHGTFTLHPESLEAMLTDLRENIRRAVAQAWSEYQQSLPSDGCVNRAP